MSITRAVTSKLDRIEPGQPVVLLLHGYGADERDLPDLMQFLPDLPFASLQAPEPAPNGGRAWFQIIEPLNPTAAQMETATQAIWDWVEQNLPDDSPLIVLGFSQGGLMATQLLRTQPERLLATVILSGFVFRGAQPADEALQANKPKVLYCRGLQDTVISKDAVAALNPWLQAHTRAVTKTFDGLGHSVDQRVMEAVREYVDGQLG